MDLSPEDSSALFSHEARMQQATAAFAYVLSHCSPALVWRTPSRLDPKTHSDLPTNCRNQLGELSHQKPTHFTSLQMVTIHSSSWACKQGGKKLQISFLILQVIHSTPFPSIRKGNVPLYGQEKVENICNTFSHPCSAEPGQHVPVNAEVVTAKSCGVNASTLLWKAGKGN